jgi:hypothetical protein
MKKIVRTVATICLAIALSNVPFTIGQANGSGIGKYVYFVAASDIEAWPTITDNIQDATSAAAYIGYTGNFTLKEDALFIRIYNTQGEGVLSAEATGERDSKMYLNKLSFRFPKLTQEAAVLSDAVVNGDGVFIAWHDGAYRVVGHSHYRCDVTPNVTSGDAAGSSKGVTFEAECPDYKALPIYTGKIQFAPDAGDTDHDYYELDCSTDVITKHAPSA